MELQFYVDSSEGFTGIPRPRNGLRTATTYLRCSGCNNFWQSEGPAGCSPFNRELTEMELFWLAYYEVGREMEF